MYKSLNIAEQIKIRAKQQGIIIKDMLSELGLGSNTMSNLRHGRMIAADSLAKIADYLDCSVDYLLGRTNIPEEKGITDMIMDLDEEQLRQLLSYTEFLKAQQDAGKQKKD